MTQQHNDLELRHCHEHQEGQHNGEQLGHCERSKTDPCAAPAPVLYASLIEELEATRASHGGALSDESESAFVERLDDLWWQMTDEEQDDYKAQTR